MAEPACETIISRLPPSDGRDWECQCARCGSSCTRIDCESCDHGYTAPGELHEEDPLWYDEDDFEACHICLGSGGWWACMSSAEHCQKNPAPGRERVEPGVIEWFTFDKKPEVAGGR